ncbi:MAG: hypothetical protein ACI8Y7_000711 [Candidatus Woesearchaeota archaeon]|jgi:hypothetical protein
MITKETILYLILIFTLILVGCSTNNSEVQDEVQVQTELSEEDQNTEVTSEPYDNSELYVEHCSDYYLDVYGCALLASKIRGHSTTQMLGSFFDLLGAEYTEGMQLQEEPLELKEIYESSNSKRLIFDMVTGLDNLWILEDIEDVPSLHDPVRIQMSNRGLYYEDNELKGKDFYRGDILISNALDSRERYVDAYSN